MLSPATISEKISIFPDLAIFKNLINMAGFYNKNKVSLK